MSPARRPAARRGKAPAKKKSANGAIYAALGWWILFAGCGAVLLTLVLLAFTVLGFHRPLAPRELTGGDWSRQGKLMMAVMPELMRSKPKPVVRLTLSNEAMTSVAKLIENRNLLKGIFSLGTVSRRNDDFQLSFSSGRVFVTGAMPLALGLGVRFTAECSVVIEDSSWDIVVHQAAAGNLPLPPGWVDQVVTDLLKRDCAPEIAETLKVIRRFRAEGTEYFLLEYRPAELRRLTGGGLL